MNSKSKSWNEEPQGNREQCVWQDYVQEANALPLPLNDYTAASRMMARLRFLERSGLLASPPEAREFHPEPIEQRLHFLFAD